MVARGGRRLRHRGKAGGVRAATIDVVAREMWRFLGRYADVGPVDVEGLAEASEPFIDLVELELVDQLRSELEALRLASFPRV